MSIRKKQPKALLTRRQIEVLRLVARGYRNREVADLLFVGETTVDYHLCEIYLRLNVHTRTGAIRAAQALGLIAVPREGDKNGT